MKRVIRSWVTGKYLDSNWRWTGNIRRAQNFSSFQHAQDATNRLQLQGVELYCLSEGAQNTLNNVQHLE